MCGLAGTNNESGQDLQPLLMVVGPRVSIAVRHEAQSRRSRRETRGRSPRPRVAPSSGCRDLDLVGDAENAVEARHVVVGRVALELVVDPPFEGQPAFVHLHVN